MAAVKYDGGALLSYSIIFSAPYEGYRLTINGTKGRIESNEFHEPSRIPFAFPEQTIEYYPLFESKQTIQVVKNEGGMAEVIRFCLRIFFRKKTRCAAMIF